LGWWSYSFCYNNGVTQFHQLPPQAGRPVFPPQRDMNTPLYVLGRAKPKGQKTQREEGEGEGEGGGNELEVRKAGGAPGGLGSEMQVKGDTRYLMQTLEHGTVCDLTGRPRRIEIQYHCAPSTTDKIGWIKEVTTCSYLMVVYTPRLCNDVAFLPPKETKAHEITCSAIISEDEILEYEEKKRDEKAMKAFNAATKLVDTIDIGGMALGGGKYFGRDTGLHLPMPKNLGINNGVDVEVVPVVIARSKGEGHPVESLTDEQLVMMDLKPEAVEQLREELAEMAGKKPWRLEVVQPPGEIKEIRAIVEEDEEMKEHANEWENGRKEKEKEKLEKENIEQSGKQKVPKIAKEEEKVKMKQNAKEGQMQKSQEREKEKEKEKEKETDSEEGSEETYHEDL
jgi:protein OS-9